MNLLIFVLSVAGFIVIAVMRVTDLLLPIVAHEFNVSIGRTGVIVTAFAVPYGLFQLVYGPLGDRLGKLKVIATALSASAVFTFACGFAMNLEMLTCLRFMSGMTTAAVVPLSMAFIADNVVYTDRQAAIGRYLSGLMIGSIAGGSLAGVGAEFLGWHAIFLVFGVLTGVIAWPLWRVVAAHLEPKPAATPKRNGVMRAYLDLLRGAAARAVILTVAIEGFFFFGGLTFIGAYLIGRFDLGYAHVGLMLGGFGIGGLIYSSSVRRIVAVLGERRMVIIGTVLMTACYLALSYIPQWEWAVLLLVILGFGFYMMHNTLQTLATELAPHARGTAVSLFAFALFAGQGAGVAVLGPIIDGHGFPSAFAFVAFGMALLGSWFQQQLARGKA